MPKIVFLPNPEICSQGSVIDVKAGDNLLNAALYNGINIKHACNKSCACATCHVIVKKGFHSINVCNEVEEDMLDKAWGLEWNSRLACQIIVSTEDLVIEIPKYTT